MGKNDLLQADPFGDMLDEMLRAVQESDEEEWKPGPDGFPGCLFVWSDILSIALKKVWLRLRYRRIRRVENVVGNMYTRLLLLEGQMDKVDQWMRFLLKRQNVLREPEGVEGGLGARVATLEEAMENVNVWVGNLEGLTLGFTVEPQTGEEGDDG